MDRYEFNYLFTIDNLDNHGKLVYIGNFQLTADLKPEDRPLTTTYLRNIDSFDLTTEVFSPLVTQINPDTDWVDYLKYNQVIRTNETMYSARDGLEIDPAVQQNLKQIFPNEPFTIVAENEKFFVYFKEYPATIYRVERSTGNKIEIPNPGITELQVGGILEDGRLVITSPRKLTAD